MKSIELTEEHKSKLLEMCKKLFPENKVDSLQFGTIKFLINYYERKDPNNSKITFRGWDEVVEIHWFEFCICWLATVIYNKGKYNFNYIIISQFRGYLCQDVEHPVDYLYKEFEELK